MELRDLWMSGMVKEVPDGEMKKAVLEEVSFELASICNKDYSLWQIHAKDPNDVAYFEMRARLYEKLQSFVNEELTPLLEEKD